MPRSRSAAAESRARLDACVPLGRHAHEFRPTEQGARCVLPSAIVLSRCVILGAMESVADAVERLNRLAATAELSRLAQSFAAAGHELSLVGGPVRDAFLGRPVTDLDLTTDATPDQTLAIVSPTADAVWE